MRRKNGARRAGPVMVLTGGMALLLAAAPAYAGAVGPGVTPITGSGQVGPGVSGPGAAVRDNPNNYYYKSISDPVVQPTDKYSYGQMVNDIRALERRYGEHMAVNTIGRSADGRDIYQIIVGSPKASRRLLIQSAIRIINSSPVSRPVRYSSRIWNRE